MKSKTRKPETIEQELRTVISECARENEKQRCRIVELEAILKGYRIDHRLGSGPQTERETRIKAEGERNAILNIPLSSGNEEEFNDSKILSFPSLDSRDEAGELNWSCPHGAAPSDPEAFGRQQRLIRAKIFIRVVQLSQQWPMEPTPRRCYWLPFWL